MNYYLAALVLVIIIFVIVVAKLIFKIHELLVKIKDLNEYMNTVLNVVKDYTIITKEIMENVDSYLEYQNNHLNAVEQYIRNELADELNAIGKTTTEQADIMLNIEKNINELKLDVAKEGDAIESERIPTDCTEDGIS